MRIKRSKHYKKIIQFYKSNFDFKEPFKVVLDGNFIEVFSRMS